MQCAYCSIPVIAGNDLCITHQLDRDLYRRSVADGYCQCCYMVKLGEDESIVCTGCSDKNKATFNDDRDRVRCDHCVTTGCDRCPWNLCTA